METDDHVGSWEILNDGICYEGYYFIELERFFEERLTWLDHLRDKNWFDTECEHHFLIAYYRCLQRNKLKVTLDVTNN